MSHTVPNENEIDIGGPTMSQTQTSVSSPSPSTSHHQPFIQLSTEAKELYLETEISRITTPSSLEFYRDYVARNKPVIITDAINDWPALAKWTKKNYLRSKIGKLTVTVDRVPLDPNLQQSFGDSVVDGKYFVTPSEEQMKFSEFLDYMENKNKNPAEGVLYCQHQNSSLTEEFACLTEDVPELAFATNAFNASPDAVNLWFGENRSVSTLHCDPYENLYAVITGSKQFLLYPPSDYHWLDKREYPRATWTYDKDAVPPATINSSSTADPSALSSDITHHRFTLIPDADERTVAWFDLEPQGNAGREEEEGHETNQPDPSASSTSSSSSSSTVSSTATSSIPLLRVASDSSLPLPAPGPFPPYSTHPRLSPELRREHASPVWVDLQPGEVLYLPSLWFHRVAQTGDAEGKTIAVNSWYDMAYDSRYNYFRFLESVSKQARDASSASKGTSQK